MRGPFKQPALLFWLSPSFFLSLSFSPTRLVIMTGGTRANETVVDFPSLLLCRASVSPLSPMLPSRTWTLGDLAFSINSLGLDQRCTPPLCVLSDLPFKTDRKATPLICAASLD